MNEGTANQQIKVFFDIFKSFFEGPLRDQKILCGEGSL